MSARKPKTPPGPPPPPPESGPDESQVKLREDIVPPVASAKVLSMKDRQQTLLPPAPTLTVLPEDPFSEDDVDPEPEEPPKCAKKRAKVKTSAKAAWSMAEALRQLEAIMAICRQRESYEPMREQAAAKHFVALYAHLFQKVYGVESPTMSPHERVGAAAVASNRLKADFKGDAAEMARYFAFVWDREAASLRANEGVARRVITWELMMVKPHFFYDYAQHVMKQRAKSRPSGLFAQAPAGA